jgi:hypothetical protein
MRVPAGQGFNRTCSVSFVHCDGEESTIDTEEPLGLF